MALTVNALPCYAAYLSISALSVGVQTRYFYRFPLFSSTLRKRSIAFSFFLLLKLFCSVANVSDGLDGFKVLI